MTVQNTTAVRVGGLLAWAALGAVAPASAQNLLGNAAFDGSLASWANYGSAVPADGGRVYAAFPDDALGVAGSGSVQLTLGLAATAGTQVGIAQCVPVAAGQNYNYGARLKQPSGQGTSGDARTMIDIVFYSDGACATSLNLGEGLGVGVGVAYPLSDETWRAVPGTVPTSGGSVVAPAGAASAQFRLLIERTASGGAAVVHYDRAFFGMNLTPVQLQTYTVD